MPPLISKAWALYRSSLERQPLLTKATTAAVIMSMSDILSQKVAVSIQSDYEGKLNWNQRNFSSVPLFHHGDHQHDWRRTRDAAITGFSWSGPISHLWYGILENVVRIDHRLWGLVVRLFLDAAVFSPIAVFGYFLWRTLLEGKGLQGVIEKLRAKWKSALFASWRFWPLSNIINFAFVPLQYRVLYSNCLSLLWNGYLSFVNSSKTLSPTRKQET